MILRFVSKNKQKTKEIQLLLEKLGIEVIPLDITIDKIQHQHHEVLIKDKLLKAFKKVQRPLFLEHTGLYFNDFKNYPGGLTESFWNSLGAGNITQRFYDLKVRAKTTIAYCDGKSIHLFEGDIQGKISRKPLGDSIFQWDTIFIPDGHSQTFAEMGYKKHEISMRKIAINNFYIHLKDKRNSND